LKSRLLLVAVITALLVAIFAFDFKQYVGEVSRLDADLKS